MVLLAVTGPVGTASAQRVPAPSAGALPAESSPSHVRAALLPDPDVFTRADRLAIVIQAMLDQLARGNPIGPDLRTADAAYTNDALRPRRWTAIRVDV